MRYYIYLDKELLQTLFSTVENTNFDIEVIEYSERKNYGTNNEFSIDPHNERICSSEASSNRDETEKKHDKNRCENIHKNGVGLSFECNNTYNIETEKRYINIEDISNMKKGSFYHRLVNMLNNEVKKTNSRIVLETGIVASCNKEEFFRVNDSYIWVDENKLNLSMNKLCNLNCRINVVGYLINEEKQKERIIKAVAIYIE